MQPAEVAPSEGLYEPALHDWQSLLCAAPVASLNLPAAQRVQFVLAGAPENVPAGHFVQRRLPAAALKLPAAQAAQPTTSEDAPRSTPM